MTEDEKNRIKNNRDNIDLAFSVMRMKLEVEKHMHNSLESKIGVLFGFVGVMAGSAIVVIRGKKELVGLNIFTLGLIGIYLVVIFLAIALQTRQYLDPPDFSAFYTTEALAKQNIDLKNQVIADMKATYLHNIKIQGFKSLYYNLSIWSFVASVLLLFLGILEK